MRIFKSHPLLKLANSYVIDSPQPSNLSYLWNFGSLLAFCLVIQIVTGVTLAMHYNPSVLEAFNSVEHIMRDVNNGWLVRYLHSNTASAFFFLVYLHIGRNLYYASYKAPRTLTFVIGVVILIAMMATAFLGYVLPYGQMSLWGATVITNLMSAIPWIGQDIVEFIWGGFSVNNATLNRFFALHFILPFVIAALALMHLIALHDSAGSSNPLGVSGNYDRLSFAPYFIFKDLITIFYFILVLSVFVFFMPNILGDSENYVMANPMQTPPAIVPEWYLLPFYAILRSIPNKLLGVIAMFSALLVLLTLPFTDLSRSRGAQFKPFTKVVFWIFVCNFLLLMVLGAKHVEDPFIEVGQVSTALYFLYFLYLIPQSTLVENTFVELPSPSKAEKFEKQPELGNVVVLQSSFINTSQPLWELFSYNIVDIDTLILPMPGVKCIKCAAKGIETWVLQGKACPKCGHMCSVAASPVQPVHSGSPVELPDSISLNGPTPEPRPSIGLTFACKSYVKEWLLILTCGAIVLIGPIVCGIPIFTGPESYLFQLISQTNIFEIDLLDAPRPWGLYFQDSASPQMEGLEELHDSIMFYLVIILFAVGWILASVLWNYTYVNTPSSHKYQDHGPTIELVWTITPALILILIAFPSFKLLYLMDEVSDPAMAVLAEGHQWYWSYQYPDFLNTEEDFIEFDSYLVPEADLELGTLRMLEVDNRVILPQLTHVRFIVTAADVIHSYACPSLGIKCDAYPGRLSQVSVLINRIGVFYGQCSEICGILHSSMPIVIESLPIEKFLAWLRAQ